VVACRPRCNRGKKDTGKLEWGIKKLHLILHASVTATLASAQDCSDTLLWLHTLHLSSAYKSWPVHKEPHGLSLSLTHTHKQTCFSNSSTLLCSFCSWRWAWSLSDTAWDSSACRLFTLFSALWATSNLGMEGKGTYAGVKKMVHRAARIQHISLQLCSIRTVRK